MAYGFDLGKLKSSSIGMSYVDRIWHTGGTSYSSRSSSAFSYANSVRTFVTPAADNPYTVIASYPSVSTSLDRNSGTVSVTVSGGNVAVNVLIFVG